MFFNGSMRWEFFIKHPSFPHYIGEVGDKQIFPDFFEKELTFVFQKI